MKSIFKSVGLLFLVELLITFVFRLSFYVFFISTSSSQEIKWPLMALIHGLRFDLSALVCLNLIFILFLYFKPIRQNQIFLYTWALFSTLYVTLLIADINYYSLYNSRLGWDFLAAIEGVDENIFINMISKFALLFFFVLFCFYFFKVFIFKLFRNINFSSSIKFYPIYFLAVLAVSLITYRGGFQQRVLCANHTWLYSNGDTFFAAMTSNSLHNLIRAKRGVDLPDKFEKPKQSYLPTWTINQTSTHPILNKAPKNVLFIFIESLSSYAFEQNHLPHLKKLISEKNEHLHFYTNSYANGNLSKDALLSVFFGLPSYFNIHLFDSKYSKNTFDGFGQIAKLTNKKTFFLHAAPGGTQFFDVISNAAGFKNYISIFDEFDGDESLSSIWGVHDEVLYQESLKYITQLNHPFIGTLFTTSTHNPYSGTPNNLKGTGDSEKDYFLAMSYADEQLKKFFDQASTRTWYKDTLFILTGDHSPPLSATWNREIKEISRVPIMFYWPGSELKQIKFKAIGRHVDIPKTIFEILGQYPKNWTPYGQSLIQNSLEESNVFYTNSNAVNVVTDKNEIISKSVHDELSKLNLMSRANKELLDYVYRLERNSIYK